MTVLPPDVGQADAGRVQLEYVRDSLGVSSISVSTLVQYLTNNGIPLDARITADVFHDQPFLELVWETL